MRYRYMQFPGGKQKAVTLSYDDGVKQDLRFIEVINRYGLKCTFNINSGYILGPASERYLSAEDVRKHMLGNGHEIAVHGQYHRANGSLRPIDGIQDVLNCRLELEKEYGIIIRGMAYPDSGITRFQNGAEYSEIRTYLKQLDIAYARTLGGDNRSFYMPTDWYAWMPTAHHNNPNVLDYAREFVEIPKEGYISTRYPRLFYLWGHSYEFDQKNNWDHLEELCGILGNHQDIWYATNMEIYNYAQAYERLEYSADGTRVYNPSLTDVWFVDDGKDYCVRSGETLVISE